MLALLECVVKQEGVAEESLRPHAEMLLKEMVLPNAVWRAGLVAATVRKVRCGTVPYGVGRSWRCFACAKASEGGAWM